MSSEAVNPTPDTSMGPPAAVAAAPPTVASPMPPPPPPPVVVEVPVLGSASNKRPPSPGVSVQRLFLDDLGLGSRELGGGAKKLDARPSPVWNSEARNTDAGLPAVPPLPTNEVTVMTTTTTTVDAAAPACEAFSKTDDDEKKDDEPVEEAAAAETAKLPLSSCEEASSTTSTPEDETIKPPEQADSKPQSSESSSLVGVKMETPAEAPIPPSPRTSSSTAAVEAVAVAVAASPQEDKKEEEDEVKNEKEDFPRLKPAVQQRKRLGFIKTENNNMPGGRWSIEEDDLLRLAVSEQGPQNWKKIAEEYLGKRRSDVQCLHRWQKVLQPGLVKGPWTKEEDDVIVECRKNGITKWADIADRVPGRIGKQCRERWFNHLDPDLKKGGWTKEEDAIIAKAQAEWGNCWTKIANLLPGRSENTVKNRWNSATRRARPSKSKSKSSVSDTLWNDSDLENRESKPSQLDPTAGYTLFEARTKGQQKAKLVVGPNDKPRRSNNKKSSDAAAAQSQEQTTATLPARHGMASYDLDGPVNWDDFAGLDPFHDHHLPAAPPSSLNPMPAPMQQQQEQQQPPAYTSPAPEYPHPYHVTCSSFQAQTYPTTAPPSNVQAPQPSYQAQQLHALGQAAATTGVNCSQQQPLQYTHPAHHAEYPYSGVGYTTAPPLPQMHSSQQQMQQQQYNHQSYQPPLGARPLSRPVSAHQQNAYYFSAPYDMQQQRPMSSGRRYSPSAFLEAHSTVPTTNLSGLSPSFASSYPSVQPAHLQQQHQQQHQQQSHPHHLSSHRPAYAQSRGISPPAVSPAMSHPQMMYPADEQFLRSPLGQKDHAGLGIIGAMLTEGYQPEELHTVDYFLA